MWITQWALGDGEEGLANVLDQVQDVVMESETEPWPMCPLHYHPLDPRPARGWVAWRCPTLGQHVAGFGSLGGAAE
jgi:hypothetical protein